MPGPPAAAAGPRVGPARGGGGRAAAAAWRLQVQQAGRQPLAHVTNAAAVVIEGAGPGPGRGRSRSGRGAPVARPDAAAGGVGPGCPCKSASSWPPSLRGADVVDLGSGVCRFE